MDVIKDEKKFDKRCRALEVSDSLSMRLNAPLPGDPAAPSWPLVEALEAEALGLGEGVLAPRDSFGWWREEGGVDLSFLCGDAGKRGGSDVLDGAAGGGGEPRPRVGPDGERGSRFLILTILVIG